MWTGWHSTTWGERGPGTEPAEEGAGTGMKLSTCAPPAAHWTRPGPHPRPIGTAQGPGGQAQKTAVGKTGETVRGFPGQASLPRSAKLLSEVCR